VVGAIALVFHASPADIAPVTSSESPSAMVTNNAQRSAMWLPSTFQLGLNEFEQLWERNLPYWADPLQKPSG
jgi:hypothetical protein